MGNSPSTDQGSPLPHGQQDVSASVCEEQHDWSKEQAEAPETHSLYNHKRNSYNGAQRGARKLSTDDDTQSGAYNGAQLRNRKSLVMKDDGSSSEDERDDSRGAQQRDQRSPRLHRKSPSPQPESSSSDEEKQEQRRASRRQEEERRSSRRREKTRGNMQVEPETGQTAYIQVEPDTGRPPSRFMRPLVGWLSKLVAG